jgi:hypothetical protein
VSKEALMKSETGSMEILKLVLISLALVFAVSAFAMILLRSDGADAVQIVRTIKLPEPPPPPPLLDEEEKDKYFDREREKEKQTLVAQEIEELEDRQKRADAAVAKLRAKYEKDGKLPERIILETPTDRPKPVSPDQDAMPNSAPLTVFTKEKRLEFNAYIVLDRTGDYPPEVLLAGPRGKLHETLLKTFINPYDLWQALALLGLRQSYSARGKGDRVFLEGDRVIVEVEYKEKNGKQVRRRLEDFFYHTILDDHMPYEGWVYIGSHFAIPRRFVLRITPAGEVLDVRVQSREEAEQDLQKPGEAGLKVPGDVLEAAENRVRFFVLTGVREEKTGSGEIVHVLTGTEGEEFLIAGKTENIITTWHWPWSILDNPLAEAGDDALYRIYEGVVPPRGTKLRVIMTVDEKYNKNRPESQPLWSKGRR